MKSGSPSTAEATPAASLPEYQENILLYVLLLGGFFLAWDLRVFAVAGIISVIAVYYDAGTLHAGQNLRKVILWRCGCMAADYLGSMGPHRIADFPCSLCLLPSGDLQRK